jgi:1-phosphofructokinase
MIYTLTLAPSLDYYMDVEYVKQQRVNRAKETRMTVGGKGINVSMMLGVLGTPNTAVIVTGSFTGEEIKRNCTEAGLNIIPVEIKENSRINVKMAYGEFNAPAPRLESEEDINALTAVLSDINKKAADDDILVISGSAGIDLRKIGKLWTKRLIADTSGRSLSEVINCKPFLVKPNHIELCDYFQKPATTSKIIADELAHTLKRAGAMNVAVTLGKKGAYLLTESGETFRAAPHDIRPKNTVGAGDSFLAGFITGLLKTDDMSYALALANACGAAAAESEGLPELSRIKGLLLETGNEY